MNRYVMLIGVCLAAFLAVGMFRAKSGAASSAERIDDLKTDIAGIESEIDLLQKEFESLTSESRIGELASEHLGMHPPRAQQMMTIETATNYFGPLTEREDSE